MEHLSYRLLFLPLYLCSMRLPVFLLLEFLYERWRKIPNMVQEQKHQHSKKNIKNKLLLHRQRHTNFKHLKISLKIVIKVKKYFNVIFIYIHIIIFLFTLNMLLSVGWSQFGLLKLTIHKKMFPPLFSEPNGQAFAQSEQ